MLGHRQRVFSPLYSELVQPVALSGEHAEAQRRDFEIKLTVVPLCDAVELGGAVRYQARENVETAGRAFGVRHAIEVRRQGQRFLQLDEVDDLLVQDRAFGEVDLLAAELRRTLHDGAVRAGEKARIDPESPSAEPEIEARGLVLVGLDRLKARDHAGLREPFESLRGVDARAARQQR